MYSTCMGDAKMLNSGESWGTFNSKHSKTVELYLYMYRINIMALPWTVTGSFFNLILYFSFRDRAVAVVDSLKARLTDPCITCHWSSIGCDTTTLASIHITSPEVGNLARLVTYFSVSVLSNTVMLHIENLEST